MPENRSLIADSLRTRILRGLRSGVLVPGDRLPSARELVAEFDVDHRIVLSAYRDLADEGLVEIRERGGVYVARPGADDPYAPAIPARLLSGMLSDAYARELSASELVDWLQRAIDTLRLRAIVISSTEDQVAGLARELRDDFGLLAEGMTAARAAEASADDEVLRRAHLLVTTRAHEELVDGIAARLGIPSITIDVRPDLVAGEWAMLLRQPTWAVVGSVEFGAMLRQFFAAVPGVENLTILVAGRDDLTRIPEGAPTYVTHRVRESIDLKSIRGRILPPARTIGAESARPIFEFIVRANVLAFQQLRRTRP